METILITWSSGFIWYHVSKKLLAQGETVIGLDNENDYYDINLKHARRQELEKFENFKFYKGNLEDLAFVKKLFEENRIDKVLNLAAQAGVRYSLVNPYAYIQTNIVGFHNNIISKTSFMPLVPVYMERIKKCHSLSAIRLILQ